MTDHSHGLGDPPDPGGRIVDAQLNLMDRQVLDEDGTPITVVDDLELSDLPHPGESVAPGTAAPRITAVLSGAVLATRIFGGRPPASRLHRIPWETVKDVDTVLRLGVKGDSLDVTWVERWLRDRIIARIPGGRHDPE
ncbi:hypothetical protein [Sinomonas gamaensis]|uniref:hypothetical protein n=1 Tax=Sinomonas gamaensis TaxID=2565624 RepID=UPI001107F01C|nr:hypothetical protein [Sinomonas gamaensis]